MATVGVSYGAKPMNVEFTLLFETSAVPVLPATCTPETWVAEPVPFSTTSSMASLTCDAVVELTAWPSERG